MTASSNHNRHLQANWRIPGTKWATIRGSVHENQEIQGDQSRKRGPMTPIGATSKEATLDRLTIHYNYDPSYLHRGDKFQREWVWRSWRESTIGQ